MYDTSNPYKWKYYKTVQYHHGQWTITDASLSPDNRFLAYSSIQSIVSLAPTDPSDISEPLRLNFSIMSHGNSRPGHREFGVCPTYMFHMIRAPNVNDPIDLVNTLFRRWPRNRSRHL